MTNDSGMVCGNCAHYRKDGHCDLYPAAGTTEPDFEATQQLYCDWEWVGESVAVQFAKILEKHARHVRDTEDEILILIKTYGFSSTFGDLIRKIVDECADEELVYGDD